MLKSIINLFFPPVCSGCHSFLLSNEKVICTLCRHNMPLTQHLLNPENEAFKKFYGRMPVEFGSTLLYFHKKGIVQELIHNLKYKGHEDIGLFLGEWLGEELSELKGFQDIDVVVPVPLHKSRQRKRGYNQVHKFAQAIADKLHVECNTSVLQKTKATQTQVFKDRLKRWNDDNTVFSVSNTEDFKGKHILLVDDVITTGATLEACSNALLKIEGIKISVVTMAIAS